MKITNLKIFFLLISSVIVLSITSEIFYNYRNNTPFLVSTYLKISWVCLEKKIYSCSSYFLKRASNVRYRYYVKLYPNIIDRGVNLSINRQIFEKYFLEKHYFTESKLTPLYYELGLKAYKNGDTDSALSVWQNLIYIDPDLSYVYVEIANLFQKIGKPDVAKQTLETCIKFVYPRKHCQEFLNTHILNTLYEEPGFLREEIEKSIVEK